MPKLVAVDLSKEEFSAASQTTARTNRVITPKVWQCNIFFPKIVEDPGNVNNY